MEVVGKGAEQKSVGFGKSPAGKESGFGGFFVRVWIGTKRTTRKGKS